MPFRLLLTPTCDICGDRMLIPELYLEDDSVDDMTPAMLCFVLEDDTELKVCRNCLRKANDEYISYLSDQDDLDD